jgi:Protein of unknown function (DUF3455)
MLNRLLLIPVALVASAGCRQARESVTGSAGDVCQDDWLQAPAVDPALSAPDGGGRVLLHAAATGTQNYGCTRAGGDAGAHYTWTLAGPEAALSDCRGAVIGRHFASDAGASAPEWQLVGGSYVVGHKLAAWTPEGGSGSVPWVLLGADDRGGGQPLDGARYVERVRTRGGVAPGDGCDADRLGAMQKVPYSADYFFLGP